jgi:hypothetical protein
MRRLERGVLREDPPQDIDGGLGLPRLVMEPGEAEPGVDEALAEPFPPRRKGVGVRVVGQEHPLIQVDRLEQLLPDGALGRLLERVDVDPRRLG